MLKIILNYTYKFWKPFFVFAIVGFWFDNSRRLKVYHTWIFIGGKKFIKKIYEQKKITKRNLLNFLSIKKKKYIYIYIDEQNKAITQSKRDFKLSLR